MLRFLTLSCVLVGCGLCCGCGAGLSWWVVSTHPPLVTELPKPTVLAASAAQRPVWLSGRRLMTEEDVELLGQASAKSREQAKRRAVEDLFAAVARFVRTDVQADFEATDTLRDRDGEVSHSFSADDWTQLEGPEHLH